MLPIWATGTVFLALTLAWPRLGDAGIWVEHQQMEDLCLFDSFQCLCLSHKFLAIFRKIENSDYEVAFYWFTLFSLYPLLVMIYLVLFTVVSINFILADSLVYSVLFR